MKRYFFINETGKQGDHLTIDGQEHTHISKVLRLKIGDEIVCLPNDGSLLNSTIISIDKSKTIVRVDSIEHPDVESHTRLTVYVAMPKGDKFEFLITKLTEIGVARIVPFESEYIVAKPLNKKDRYLTIAKEACKQCRRTRLIEVDEPMSFDKMLDSIKEYDVVVFASELEKEHTINELDFTGVKNVAVIIGSEGGFSEREANQIVSQGAVSITLGKRILRAETAGLVVPAIVQYMLGEFAR